MTWLPCAQNCSGSRSNAAGRQALRDALRGELFLSGLSTDHYLLEPHGDTLEVIETTGGSPLPAQFFMRFEDESGLVAPRDPAYACQSAGTARLGDGTVIGGVRHQFRDEGNRAMARLMVEFPAATPGRMIREHQWHLACEFSHWLREARRRAERAT